jgi:hypothetical protein
MMRALCLAAMASAAALGPPYMKLDDALAAAVAADKLVAVYATMGAGGEVNDHGAPDADAAMVSKPVAARYGEFLWVKAADKVTAKRVDSPSAGPNLIFLDPDGASIGSWNVQLGGEVTVLKAMDEAKAAYQPRPVPWTDAEPDEKGPAVKRKLIIYAFLDDKEASEKAVKSLEHPWVARDHARLVLVRKYVLDSPLAKRFKITSVPTLVFVDPGQKEGKEIIDRKSGEITPRMIRAPMKKCFDRIKRDLEQGK